MSPIVMALLLSISEKLLFKTNPLIPLFSSVRVAYGKDCEVLNGKNNCI